LLNQQTTGKKWMTMKLNQCFHYGQNGEITSLKRFVVYHPIDPPAIFQHRFTGLRVQDFINHAGTTVSALPLPSMVPTDITSSIKSVTDAASKGLDSVKAVVGHYLHRYLDQSGVEEAKARWRQQKERQSKTPGDSVKEMGALLKVAQADPKASKVLQKMDGFKPKALNEDEMYILALQVIETVRAKGTNEQSDERMRMRAKEQVEYMNALTETDETPKSLFDKFVDGFLDMFKSEQKAYKELFSTVNNATKRGLQDADDVMLLGLECFATANHLSAPGNEIFKELKKHAEDDKKFQASVKAMESEAPPAPNLVEKAVLTQTKPENIIGKQLGTGHS
jgi:hypothetical protein